MNLAGETRFRVLAVGREQHTVAVRSFGKERTDTLLDRDHPSFESRSDTHVALSFEITSGSKPQ